MTRRQPWTAGRLRQEEAAVRPGGGGGANPGSHTPDRLSSGPEQHGFSWAASAAWVI